MALIGLMTAVICVLAPFSLNLPFSPVPISLGTLAIYFVISVLGMKSGTLSVVLYILLGLVGLPVFANFTGGAGKLFGPSGGYIIGYSWRLSAAGLLTNGQTKPYCVSLVCCSALRLAICSERHGLPTRCP